VEKGEKQGSAILAKKHWNGVFLCGLVFCLWVLVALLFFFFLVRGWFLRLVSLFYIWWVCGSHALFVLSWGWIVWPCPVLGSSSHN